MVRAVEARVRLYGLGVGDARNPSEPEVLTHERLAELFPRFEALQPKPY